MKKIFRSLILALRTSQTAGRTLHTKGFLPAMTESRHRQASNQRRIWTVGLIGFLLLSVVSGLLHAGTASASTLLPLPGF